MRLQQHHHHTAVANHCYSPASRVGGIQRCGASDVCLSVAYIGPKSRTEGPRKTKIGTEVAHVTRDLDTTFRVKRSKVNLQGARAYCGGLPHSFVFLPTQRKLWSEGPKSEALMADSGAMSWGSGSQPRPHQLGGLEECSKLPSWVCVGALADKRFSRILSVQSGLSRQFILLFVTLRTKLSGAVYCDRSCLWLCLQRAGGVRTLLQPVRAQCLRLSERFFHCSL